jgi:hypothetical protein
VLSLQPVRLKSALPLIVSLIAGSLNICLAQSFKPYSGAKLDDKASREASATVPGKQSEVYTTSDSLDKVYAFYKGAYKEVTIGSTGPKLPSGQQVKWYFFVLDGGTTLANSKYWMKIQHPYVGGKSGEEVRDVTIIQTVHSK